MGDDVVYVYRMKGYWALTPSLIRALQKLRQGHRTLEVNLTTMKVEQLTLPDYMRR